MAGKDSLHLVENAEEMAKRIDTNFVTWHLFKNAGGPVYKDQPQEARHTVRQFLQEKISLSTE